MRSFLCIAAALLLSLGGCTSGNGAVAQDEIRAKVEDAQVVLVVSDGWNSSTGTLRRYIHSRTGWTQQGDAIPVVLGRNGLGWGRGLHGTIASGPQKREGDGRAPAGIFRITHLFGVAAERPSEFRMPYLPLRNGVECVDDTGSVYYNRMVDSARVAVDWHSSEKMVRVMPFYRWGAFVEHNADPAYAWQEPGRTASHVKSTPGLPVRGGGSCIFLHIWGGPAVPTSGCTAMAEENLLDLLRWLDEDGSPLLVQLPREEYERRRAEWGLP